MTPMGYMSNIPEGLHSFPSLHLHPHHIGELFGAHGIPTGFRPTAQGCGNAATLGTVPPPQTQPQRGCVIPSSTAYPRKNRACGKIIRHLSGCPPWRHFSLHRFPATPLGLMMWRIPHFPRVAACPPQPWAVRRSPFGAIACGNAATLGTCPMNKPKPPTVLGPQSHT